jgi:AraC family transcriptional regulator
MQPIELTHIILEPTLIHQVAFESVDPDRIELIPYFVQPNPLVYQICLSLVQEFETNAANSTLYAESAATMLAIHLLRHHSARHHGALSQKSHPPNHQLDRAIDYIHAHLTEDISLEAIANHLGISRYHFCRMFKRSLGVSPHQYVLQQRVEKAKQMLQARKLRMHEIAIACGFSHQSHFNYHFKRLTGVSPSKFVRST